MSGGAWNYQSWQLQEKAEMLAGELATLLRAVAETEHIVDWVVSGDTGRERAEHELFDLWVRTFTELYDHLG